MSAPSPKGAVSDSDLRAWRPIIESVARDVHRNFAEIMGIPAASVPCPAEYQELVQEGYLFVIRSLQHGHNPKSLYIRDRMLRYCRKLLNQTPRNDWRMETYEDTYTGDPEQDADLAHLQRSSARRRRENEGVL